MQSQRKRIIPAREAAQYPGATFRLFERRPVNYYRDMIVEEEHGGGQRINEQEFNARIEQLLVTERQRWDEGQKQELQRRFDAGLAKGKQDGANEFKRGLDLLTEYTRVLQAEKQELAVQAEQSSVELAFALAQKIIGAELESQPERVAEIARKALQQVLDCDQVELKVNPDDFGYLRTVQSDLQALLSSSAKLELRADTTLDRGSCLIETERGALDARIASQLDTLRANVKSAQRAEQA